MFRKFSYLASVSVIASMVFNPVVQAMEFEDVRLRKSTKIQAQSELSLSGHATTQKDVEKDIFHILEEENSKRNPQLNWKE